MATRIWVIDDGDSHYSDHVLTGFSNERDADAYFKRHFANNRKAAVMAVAVDREDVLADLQQVVTEWYVTAQGSAQDWLDPEYDKDIHFHAHPYDPKRDKWAPLNETTPCESNNPSRSLRDVHILVKGVTTKQEAVDRAAPILSAYLRPLIRADIETLIDNLREGLRDEGLS